MIGAVSGAIDPYGLDLIDRNFLGAVFLQYDVFVQHFEFRKDRAAGDGQELCKSDKTQFATQVPEIHGVIFEQGMCPGIPEAIVMTMIRRLDTGKGLPVRCPQGMDKSAPPEMAVYPCGWVDRSKPIPEQLLFSVLDRQRTVIPIRNNR